MRLVSLIITLLLIGFLITKQLGSSSSENQIEEIIGSENIDVPKVPTSPKDLGKFEDDLNKFMQDSVDERAKEIEESMNNNAER